MAQSSGSGGKGQSLGYSDVLDILQIVDGVGEGCELTVDVGDFHLHFVKEGAVGVPAHSATTAAPTPVAPAANAAAAKRVGSQDVEALASEQPPVIEATVLPGDSHLYEVKSPMVGTFYRRPAPDKPPFVEVGQDVGPNDAVCLVEVMKLFNTILAGEAGRVAEICVDDAAPVAIGQVLVRIEPSA